MQAYKCHACPSAWAREHSVRVALTFRSRSFQRSDRSDPPFRTVRDDSPLAHPSFFRDLPPALVVMGATTLAITRCIDSDLQDAEKCVAWGVKARTASCLGSVRKFAHHSPGVRRHNNVSGVTVSGCWTSPLLWRTRHADFIRRSRGPTVTRAIPLQDYS